MINRQTLESIIDRVERSDVLLSGEIMILRDAVALLDDLAGTVDKIIQDVDHPGYEPDTTQSLKIIEQGDCS